MVMRLGKCRRWTLLLFWVVSVYLLYVILFGENKALEGLEMDHSHHHHAAPAVNDHEAYHDHGGGTEDPSCDTMHAMFFHTGVCQHILFSGWMTTNVGQMVGACIAVFLAGILYEGLRSWREYLFLRGAKGNQAPSQVNIAKQECGPDSNCSGQKIVRYQMLSGMHAVQTCLHMIQVFMSYLLMLIFMTYNVWLCLALVLGTGLGYFLFAWRKQSVADLTEHCQ